MIFKGLLELSGTVGRGMVLVWLRLPASDIGNGFRASRYYTSDAGRLQTKRAVQIVDFCLIRAYNQPQ